MLFFCVRGGGYGVVFIDRVGGSYNIIRKHASRSIHAPNPNTPNAPYHTSTPPFTSPMDLLLTI